MHQIVAPISLQSLGIGFEKQDELCVATKIVTSDIGETLASQKIEV